MIGRRTFKGRAVVARTNYMSGKRRAYWVECWGAAEKPNGRIEPACLTLCNQEGGPPMHHVYCDQMKRINPAQSNRTIMIELHDDHTVDLQVEDEILWRRWTKHIGLLLTIPFYPIPAEPSVGLPREFLTDIPPQFYDAQGVMAWGVVVVQAGIGEQARLKNAFCVVVVTSDDRLKIYPWNAGTVPLITWDRDKLRRSGSIGDMVFMEAGRRCRFGPGLLWMFAETSVSVSLREGLHTFLFRGGNNMNGHCRRASEVSIASNRSSGAEASFDQGSARTPDSTNSSIAPMLRRQQSTTSVSSMASDSGIGADSLATRGIHSHPSVRAKHRSPPVKQHSQLSTSSCDDPIEFDSERDSPDGGRSQTLPARRPSQQSDYCNVMGGSPPFDMEEDDSLRRHTLGVERNGSFRSLPSGKYQPSDDMSDYETMAPVKSLSTPPRNGMTPPKNGMTPPRNGMTPPRNGMTPPRNGMTTLPYQTDARHYPQTQDSLINGMKAMNVYDQVVIGNPRSNYDNVRLQSSQPKYENTSIRFKPQADRN